MRSRRNSITIVCLDSPTEIYFKLNARDAAVLARVLLFVRGATPGTPGAAIHEIGVGIEAILPSNDVLPQGFQMVSSADPIGVYLRQEWPSHQTPDRGLDSNPDSE